MEVKIGGARGRGQMEGSAGEGEERDAGVRPRKRSPRRIAGVPPLSLVSHPLLAEGEEEGERER